MTITIWNSSDKTAAVVLSNSDLTATKPSGVAVSGVRAVLGNLTGKYYFEVTPTGGSGANRGAGVALTTAALNALAGSGNNHACAVSVNSGNIWVDAATPTGSPTIGAVSNGTAIGIAIDQDNLRAFFRNGAGGNWNGSGSVTPATPSTGIDISAISGTLFPSGQVATGGDEVTANFGASGFVGTVPAGYAAGWVGLGGTLSAVGISTGEVVGTAVLVPDQTISAVGIPTGEAVGTATLVPGAVALSAAGIPSAEAIGASALLASQGGSFFFRPVF